MEPRVKIIPVLSAAILLLVFTLSLQAEIITYNDAWNQSGFSLINSDVAGVDVTFSIEQFMLEEMNLDGRIMNNIILPGIILPNDEGAPNLPGTGRYIAVPQGASATVEIVNYRTEVFSEIELAPAPKIPLETDKSPLIYNKDSAIYNRNAYYPENPVIVSEPSKIRGVDVVVLGITPFQYNPVTKELVVYRDLEIRVNFSGGNGYFGEDRLRSRYWEPLLKQQLLNYSSLPEVNLNRIRQTDEDNVEYIIIVPDDPAFLAWADSIKAWRNQQGIITGITTLTEIGGNNTTLIENYINNAYHYWDIPPAAVLLLSDYQSTGDIYGITSPIWNGYCASDNIYADVDNDDLPDIHFARITAQNYGHLETMIGKMFEYERNPPTNPGFYQNPITAGGWQTARWFIICTEICWGFMHNELGKDPVREYAIYSGTPGTIWSSNTNTYMLVNYFGPNGLGYIPANPSYLTDWGGNADRINRDINEGAFLMLHRDHGSVTGWGEPDYQISDLNGLTNDDYLFVFSINCLTGQYDGGTTCFAEAFHRMDHGALGVVAASDVSYSFVNDTYIFGMWDSMWPEFDPGYGSDLTGPADLRPAFANSAGKHYLNASSWPYNPQNKTHTNNLFHSHGDAFITMYSEVPQNLTVSHPGALLGGASEFTVTADDGAIISLTVDNVIIGVVEATGAPVPITIAPQVPGDEMLVTITNQNYYRYSQMVPVVPPEGAYVIYNDLVIDDAAAWMPNGQLDFGEGVFFDLTIENIGVETATAVDVTISTGDEYTTILDDFESYGDVPEGGLVLADNAFEIEVSYDVPDQHNIIFELSATSGDSTWTSAFVVEAHCPVVAYNGLLIEDPTGNQNNQVDPGETVDFNVTVVNEGTSDASNVEITISTSEPMINIPITLGTVAALAAGAEATVTYTGITADASMSNGTPVEFVLEITADGGIFTEDGFGIVVGDERYQPSGPDNYGYLAYDMYDAASVYYDWFEIAPSAGGPGSTQTFGDDQTRQINLPFSFTYYGNSFTQISICSNGWVAMGYQTTADYSNSGIPNSDGPSNMIAGFWDDLNPNNGGQIAWYHDTAGHRFLIEFYQIPHYSGGGIETFQVVLYDPAFHLTPTGDGNIQIYYHSVGAAGSVTCGIENGSETDGIQFLYNGTYDEFAMSLENEFSIMYTTGFEMPELTVTLEPQGTPIVIPASGGEFDWDITIENIGTSFASFAAWTDVTMPDGSIYGPLILRTGLGLAPGANIYRAMTQGVPEPAPSGDYIYHAYVGGYPSNIIDEDSFTFEKAAGEYTGTSPYQDWYINGWDIPEDAAMSNIPSEFFLDQNFPNPFNPETTINFGLPEDGIVKLDIFNILGRRVATLVDSKMEAGYHSVVWNGVSLSSGVYFYKIQAGDNVMIKKCILMK